MMVKIRKFRQEDLTELVNIINDSYKDSYEFIPYTEDSLLKEIMERKLNVLVAEEKGEIKGLISYWHGGWGEEIDFLCVKECENQSQIEDMLLQEVEKFVSGEKLFIALGAEKIDYEKWAKRGYKPEGGLYHMTAELKELKPIPPIPKEIVLRSLKIGEEKKLVEVVNTAYGGERLTLNSIQKWKERDPIFNEDWIHVADYKGEIVSVVVSRRDIKYNSYFRAKRGYLGPAATLPEYRGKGLASALTQKAMNFLLEKGMNCVGLYTSERNKASVNLLKKLGFKVAYRWKFLTKHFK